MLKYITKIKCSQNFWLLIVLKFMTSVTLTRVHKLACMFVKYFETIISKGNSGTCVGYIETCAPYTCFWIAYTETCDIFEEIFSHSE